jgi:type I restriction enzyme S subunit
MRELPAGWARCSLGDVVEECIGRNSEDLGSASVFGVFKGQGLRPMKDRVRAENLDRYKRVERSWFAFNPMRINIGSIARHHGTAPVLVSPDYVVFRCREERIAPDFLDQVREGTEWTRFVENSGQGGVRVRIYFDALAKLPLLLPPLAEQRKIAAILSSVDETIEKTEAVIAQLDVVKKAMLEELLTRGIPGRHSRFKQTEIGEVPEEWRVVSLENLSAFLTSGSRGWAKHYAPSGATFIRSQNVRDGALDLTDRAFVSPPPGAEGERTRVACGDVLITITGNSVGNVALADDFPGPAYVSQHVGLVRLKDARLGAFVAMWLSPGSPGNRQVLAAQYGQSKPGLNLENIRRFLVPIPSPDELPRLVACLACVDERRRRELATKMSLLAAKAALSAALLGGEKRVVS